MSRRSRHGIGALDVSTLGRRRLLKSFLATSAWGLSGCTTSGFFGGHSARGVASSSSRNLAPLRASIDRIFDVTVCLRPFRAAGPRLDTERIGDKLVVHNYGHGGSGWSLSWGSSAIAVGKALADSPTRVAVVGCGALGLTSALLLQDAGKPVTIYAREQIQHSQSMRATGSFTPDSRIALSDAVNADFPALWETMARTSLKAFRGHLGLPGNPVRWIDRYIVPDPTYIEPPRPAQDELPFANYGGRLRDLFPRAEDLGSFETPFRAPQVRRRSILMFNLSSYAQMLMTQFRLAGGRFECREFHHPRELASLPEQAVINCTGYGARALWGDESIVPVRGQQAYLIPQPEFDYALAYRHINVVPRSDGIVVQAVAGGDMRGYNDSSLEPDRQEAEAAVETLAGLYADRRRP